jgi:ATP-binding cassette subfamily B protein
MDSWAEAEWFERLRSLANERTAIIITHRFTIAMRADIILVLDEGQVVEKGTHHELLARNGLYARSWSAQIQASLHEEADEAEKVRPDLYEDISLQGIR